MTELTYTALHDFIFRRTSDAVIVVDTNRMIAQVNPAAAVLLNLSLDSLVGHSVDQALAKFPSLIHLFSSATDQQVDVRLPKRRLALGFASTLEDGMRVAVLQDVTEQRELDSRRETFVTTMAHDLRNPVGALIGYADLVAAVGELNDEQHIYLDRVKQTADRLQEIAAELVDLAWFEAGMPMQQLPIRLRTVIDGAIRATTAYAQTKQITIALSVQDPLPLIMGDRRRLEQALTKLIHNAIHYSDPERVVIVHAWGDEDKAYCSVADRGFGIAPDEIENVFDRMFRSKDARVRALPGGGLGLTIAKRIIARHGGDVSVTSSFGTGSTFTFVLPGVRP